MVICIPVTDDGQVGGGWGRAPRVAVARVADGRVQSWDEHAVGWDELHDTGPEGSHHARIARFLLEHGVTAVVAGHMGPPMVQMLGRMGIPVLRPASADARSAAVAAAETLAAGGDPVRPRLN